eukprot:TRINITY_DN1272_c0_g1_i1.p1 TRINITY_DN1272_c0_g1~~TRINITY_DN1272_c0_g1_i1.p1  ORF type:complete len:341 (+),score=120.75 TRINITY_DN1272_c0_g1_i1:53-1075(+)
MPPVEHSPHRSHAIRSFVELKSVGKACELPVVSDTLEKASSIANQLSENSSVQSAKHMVEESLKSLSETGTFNSIQGKVIELNSNPRVKHTLETVKEKMSGAVQQLDTLAAGGIDKVTTALPALNTPTPELMETTKDAARSYFSLATEYLASFGVAQVSLKIADKSLSVAEKTTKFLNPDAKSKEGILSITYSKLRQTRRALRAVKRAGERKSYLDKDTVARAGLVGRLASLLSVNSILKMAGLKIVVDKPGRPEVDVDDEDDQHREITDLRGDLEGYKSDEDPDYHPDNSEDDSLDSSSDSGEETDDEMSEDKEATEDKEDSDRRVPLSPATEVVEGQH